MLKPETRLLAAAVNRERQEIEDSSKLNGSTHMAATLIEWQRQDSAPMPEKSSFGVSEATIALIKKGGRYANID